MSRVNASLALVVGLVIALSQSGSASGHREAPITALDPAADITDVFAFVSYGGAGAGTRVTLVMCVHPFLEPGNGPTWSPFDPDVLYEIKVDNNNDALEDVVFQFRFVTEQRLPSLYQGLAGAGGGVTAPANSPAPVAPGTLLVPPRITTFSDIGLGTRQRYTVNMVKTGVLTPITNGAGGPLFAVPANVGPRTLDYSALFNAGLYDSVTGIRMFAGTTDDPFFADLGGVFDTFNTSTVPVLSAVQDAQIANVSADTLSGYAVNAIAVEVPIAMLTRTGAIEPSSSPAATLGVWGSTARPRSVVRRPPLPPSNSGTFALIQRMGNPFVNELLIGTAYKDRFSMEVPLNDAQFASFFLDPTLARVVQALFGGAIAIPTPPRLDLLPLWSYAPPIAAPGTTVGPVSDMLRLNTGVPPTPPFSANRLGMLGGDPAGYPNGRRLFDDVTDITLRLVVGGVLAGPPFSSSPINTHLGDGVNVNDAPFRTAFPYLANAPSGRHRRHIDPAEPGCTAGVGAACVP